MIISLHVVTPGKLFTYMHLGIYTIYPNVHREPEKHVTLCMTILVTLVFLERSCNFCTFENMNE